MLGVSISFASLYIILSAIHLVFCYQEKELARKTSKPFLLMSLGISMYCLVPNYPLIPLACFLAMLGDILLIFKKKRLCFVIGGTFFAASHIVNLFNQAKYLPFPFPYYAVIIMVLLAPVMGLIFYFVKDRRIYFMLKATFTSFHVLNVLFSLVIFTSVDTASGFMILFGYLSCILSDIILERSTFVRDIKRRDYPIMFTYLIGQLFTYFGLAFLCLGYFR